MTSVSANFKVVSVLWLLMGLITTGTSIREQVAILGGVTPDSAIPVWFPIAAASVTIAFGSMLVVCGLGILLKRKWSRGLSLIFSVYLSLAGLGGFLSIRNYPVRSAVHLAGLVLGIVTILLMTFRRRGSRIFDIYLNPEGPAHKR